MKTLVLVVLYRGLMYITANHSALTQKEGYIPVGMFYPGMYWFPILNNGTYPCAVTCVINATATMTVAGENSIPIIKAEKFYVGEMRSDEGCSASPLNTGFQY